MNRNDGSNSHPAETVARYFGAISQRDLEAIKSCICEDAKLQFGDVELSGATAIVDGYEDFLGPMLEYKVAILHLWECAEGTVVVEGEANGKTATKFTVPFASILRFRNGRIHRQRDYFDPGKMMPNTCGETLKREEMKP